MLKMEETKAVKPFGLADKVGYLLGNLGGDFTFILASTFFMKFYTDVMGVSSVIVGILMMVAQFCDAVTDIAMGQVVDRSDTTAEGKCRPWIRRIMGPIALASLLMYASWFRDMPMTFKVVWMFVTYLLWSSVFYTMIVIPYGSMTSVITNDANERTQLSNWRHIGGTLSITVCSIIFPLVVYYTDEAGNTVLSGTRMSIAAVASSVLALICYIGCYNLTTERVKVEKHTEKFTLSGFFGDLFHNRAMIAVILLVMLYELANSALHGMNSYIYPNYFGSNTAQAFCGTLETVVVLLLAAFITVKLESKLGKKNMIILGCCIGICSFGVAFFLHTSSVIVWYVFYCIAVGGLSLFSSVCWALASEIVDDTEVRTGIRSDGTIYSLYSFARKAGQGLASGINGIMLSMIGYTAATAFDANVTTRIYDITCIVPLCGWILMVLVLAFLYPLSKQRVAENRRILEERHAAMEKAAGE
ncbi:MAG: glycoside-pentoside-hexuronide (GPH):cation symporter [Clostridiales bacterium]|nr:glycoside-pentoside-hexuronide (GPH):cation symporter [Clostridiales bacterium]